MENEEGTGTRQMSAEELEKIGQINPEWLQPIAKRYGYQLFIIAMSCGRVRFGLETIMRRVRGNRELTLAIRMIEGSADQLGQIALFTSGFSVELLKSCQQDIEQAGQLAMVEEGKRPSGLILPPN